jgi:hypothetical protein
MKQEAAFMDAGTAMAAILAQRQYQHQHAENVVHSNANGS